MAKPVCIDLSVTKSIWLTADYQRIQNPAYNSDHEPMQVYALGLHAEF